MKELEGEKSNAEAEKTKLEGKLNRYKILNNKTLF